MQLYFWTLSQKQTSCNFSSILLYWSTFQLKGPRWLSRYSYWLRAESSGNGILVGCKTFHIVQQGPGTHTVSSQLLPTLFPKGKMAHLAPRLNKEELYLCSPSGLSWPVPEWTLRLPFTVQLNRHNRVYLRIPTVVSWNLKSKCRVNKFYFMKWHSLQGFNYSCS
jgi:hypothetical protein